MKTTKCSGHWKRNRCVFTEGDAKIEIITQPNGKQDTALIKFGDKPFDSKILYEVFQRDQFNCFPYVIRCRSDDKANALAAAAQMGISERVLVNPTDSEWLYACAAAKGASKGFNASKSHKLDKIVFEWVRDFLLDFDKDLEITVPREEGSGNEDIRVVKNGDRVFEAEDKCISEQQNITERLHMVRGKGDYDLFISFVGYNLEFLPFVATHAVQGHIAKAYVEFSLAEQTTLFTEKRGRHPTLDRKKVLLPVDANDPKKGMKEGPLLKDYILSVVKSKI